MFIAVELKALVPLLLIFTDIFAQAVKTLPWWLHSKCNHCKVAIVQSIDFSVLLWLIMTLA
jgi:hypothetical protein